MISNKVTKEIVSKAEIEKVSTEKETRARKKQDFFCFLYARHRALSLKVC